MTTSGVSSSQADPARWYNSLRSISVAQWQAIALGLVLLLQFSMVFTRAINWDEFFYFAEVERFSGGQLDRGLQTIHTRLFEWLTWIPATAVDQIVTGRVIMFGFELVTTVSIIIIARRFVPREIAVCCALAYLSAGFVMQHGASFRTDPMATGLLMAALAILARSRMRIGSIIIFAILTGWSIMVTIKVALYLPAFAGMAWLRWREAEKPLAMAVRITVAALAGLGAFGLMYLVHSAQIPTTSASGPGSIIESSGRKMFFIGIPPYLHVMTKAALVSMLLTVAIVLLPVCLLKSERRMAERIALAGLAAPLLSIVFYHNTAPYFYAFILPPVALACCVSLAFLAKRYSTLLLTIALALNAVVVWSFDGESRIGKQRQILQMADQIFPNGVRYFDLCFMLPSFTKANGFMTPWGTEVYLKTGKPTFALAMRKNAVPLIVENDPMFTNLLRTNEPALEFLPEDVRAMRGSYLQFWGPLWLAGQQLDPQEVRKIDIRVPGPYSVRGGPVTVNDASYDDGDVVELARGETLISAGSQPVTLWWGRDRRQPTVPPPTGEFWTLF